MHSKLLDVVFELHQKALTVPPKLQARHTVAPFILLYVPAGQASQFDEPVIFIYVPALQPTQLDVAV